jgi:anti-sigma B factor antagonist
VREVAGNVPAEPVRIETEAAATETVISVEGELDLSGTDWFGASVAAALDEHPGSIAVNARSVTFVDSSGLRALLLAREAADRAGVAFRVRDASPALRHVVERTGLQDLLLQE